MKEGVSMKALYEQLYNDLHLYPGHDQYAHFVSMRGEEYNCGTRRFMLIGRATNGWGALTTKSATAFGEAAQNEFDDHGRWNWIESIDGTLYSTHDKDKTNLSKRYCIYKNPYCYYSKAIWSRLPGTFQDNEIWMKSIAWSNLYKVSPIECGNPSIRMQEIQLATCKEILKRELEIYKPSHILAITGFDWFAPFADLFEEVKDSGKRNVLRGVNKNADYVEGTATYGDAKVVITCRPEWRDKEAFVSAALSAFGVVS
jgi:hypothetical protein